MAEEMAKVCCMFSDPVPGHAAEHTEMELLISEEYSRLTRRIYRCRRCGAYVLYRCEESIDFCGWDNARIDECYLSIEDPTADGAPTVFPEEIRVTDGAPALCCTYREEDWEKDRHWFFVRD